jgi:methionyl-tRNA synthetase
VTDATEPADVELQATATASVQRYHAAMADHRLSDALAAMMDLAGAANGYAESQAPWALDKAGEAARVGKVLAAMAETCRIIGHLLAPVAPTGARRIHEQLGVPVPYDERGAGGPALDTLLAWGGGPSDWQAGQPAPIFPRLEVAEAAT